MGHGHLSGADDGATEVIAGYPVEERDDFYLISVDLCGHENAIIEEGTHEESSSK